MLQILTNGTGQILARVDGDKVVDTLGVIVFYLRENALLTAQGVIAARFDGNLILHPQGRILGYVFGSEGILISALGAIKGREG